MSTNTHVIVPFWTEKPLNAAVGNFNLFVKEIQKQYKKILGQRGCWKTTTTTTKIKKRITKQKHNKQKFNI